MSAQPIPVVSPRPVTVVPPGAGEALWFLDNLVHVKTSDAQGTPVSISELRVPAGSRTPMHVHHHEDEAFYVLEGALWVFTPDAEPRLVGPGTLVHLPSGTPHALFVQEAARTLLVSGLRGFLDVVRDFGEPATQATLPVLDGPPDVQRLGAVMARHGITLVGPPPTPPGT